MGGRTGCGWTVGRLHANCISLTGSKLVEARERDPPISAATRRRSRSCAASPSRAPVLAAAQQQAVSAIVRRTVTIHLRSTSTAFHHPQHAIALNWLRQRRLRLLPVCLPLWLQLPTPSPAPAPRSAGDRSPNTLPIAVKFLPWPLPSSLPPPADPQRAINVAAVAYIVGLWFLPSTDRPIAADKLALT